MFIKITNPANPLRTENFLRPYKRGEKTFTPDIAREILTMTNNPKNIRDTLHLITSQQNQADYKDIILSIFDHREQPADTITIAKNLAAANGFADELNALITQSQTYAYQDGEEFLRAAANEKAVISTTNHVGLLTSEEFISKYKGKNIIFLNKEPEFLNIDCSLFKSLRFRPDTTVYFLSTKLSENVDTSMCSKVTFDSCDLTCFPRPRGKINWHFYNTKMPNRPDFTLCSSVCLSNYNAKGTLPRFREGAKVRFYKSENFPQQMDVSNLSEIELRYCNLGKTRSLTFRKGAKVRLEELKHLPAELDFSMCSTVFISKCNLADVKKITLKNQKQYEKLKALHNWRGRIVYAAPETTPQTLSPLALKKLSQGR